MKYIVALLLCFPFTAFSQQEIAKMHVDELSSPKMYGRGYVNNGLEIAANYIDSCFTSYNLQKFSKLDGYRQIVTFPVNTFPGEISLIIGDSVLIPGVDFIVNPFSNSRTSTRNSFIYTSKLRLSNGKIGFNEINNNIIVLDERAYKTTNEQIDDISSYLQYISKQKNEINAIIELTNNKLTWGVSDYEGTYPYFIVNSNKISLQPQKVSYTIQQNFIKDFKTYNICGYIPGTDKLDSLLVFTAHYDHLGMMGNKTMFPGANDNASGIAMLLTLAKYYAAHPSKYSIVFIALTGEEIGLKGSEAFVNNPPFPLSKIKFLINFDLAGTGDEGIQVVNSTIYKKESNLLDSINTTLNLLPQIKKRGEACISDHCMFYMKGVPCFYIYTLGGIKAYHDIYDKSETLPLTKFNEYNTLMKLFIEKIE